MAEDTKSGEVGNRHDPEKFITMKRDHRLIEDDDKNKEVCLFTGTTDDLIHYCYFLLQCYMYLF